MNYYLKNRAKRLAYQREYRRLHGSKAKDRRYLYGDLPPEPDNCEACGIPFADTKKGSCVDHDHTIGKVRGYLCNGCNLALGHVGDNIHRLKALIDYLVLK